MGLMMENQAKWRAPIAVACYIALFAGILVASIIVAFIIVGFGLEIQNLSFPSSLLSIPTTEIIILGITLFFAKRKGANLKQLGLKKPKLNVVIIVTIGAILLIMLAVTISIIEEIIVGPDPAAQELLAALLPKNSLQLILLLSFSILLVGPAEEIAFRGFIQRGLQNSFGKIAGLLITSVMFGLLHGLNSLRAIIPVTIISIFLGYVWQKTDGNTIATAWMHGLYDAITITLAYVASFYV
jgi:membrane protease YdiL (CAAX protease family)